MRFLCHFAHNCCNFKWKTQSNLSKVDVVIPTLSLAFPPRSLFLSLAHIHFELFMLLLLTVQMATKNCIACTSSSDEHKSDLAKLILTFCRSSHNVLHMIWKLFMKYQALADYPFNTNKLIYFNNLDPIQFHLLDKRWLKKRKCSPLRWLLVWI